MGVAADVGWQAEGERKALEHTWGLHTREDWHRRTLGSTGRPVGWSRGVWRSGGGCGGGGGYGCGCGWCGAGMCGVGGCSVGIGGMSIGGSGGGLGGGEG